LKRIDDSTEYILPTKAAKFWTLSDLFYALQHL